ncbi:hypothetical protein ARAM_004171 [Aspergillus rambellii]|uniref:Fe2OG dioxygenase domain-containing protein n=1 Tax=Aspergillus rambellii TaxID=308745 RepID=A0A0F8V3T6_9EURO|nr:hypothetical protein ARAM_004171 [Aspergillus rambellii]
MPHEDGAAYFPLVATVSLGAPIVLDLYEKVPGGGVTRENNDTEREKEDQDQDEDEDEDGDDARIRARDLDSMTDAWRGEPTFRILQERRSLLVTRGSIYRDFLHGIAERERDQGLDANSICNWDLLREPERFQCGWYERETRISLTYRDVLRVAKLGNTMRFLR